MDSINGFYEFHGFHKTKDSMVSYHNAQELRLVRVQTRAAWGRIALHCMPRMHACAFARDRILVEKAMIICHSRARERARARARARACASTLLEKENIIFHSLLTSPIAGLSLVWRTPNQG